MIKLDIKPYCENCPYFESNVEKNSKDVSYDRWLDNHGVIPYPETDTYITCKNSEQCERFVEYLRLGSGMNSKGEI